MTKRLAWTERHWECVERVIRENGTMPWYAAEYQLTMNSKSITKKIANEIIREKIRQHRIEVVRRGSSRKGGSLYLRIPKSYGQMDADDIAQLKRLADWQDRRKRK